MRNSEGSNSEESNQFKIDKKVVIVENQDALDAEARDSAEAALTADKKELRGVSGWVKKVWKHNLFHEYYRQRGITEAKSKIVANKNLYANEGGTKTTHEQAMKSMVDRFAQEYDETIHTEAGESRKKLSREGAEGRSQESIKHLISDYAEGRIGDEAFIEERTRILSEVTGMSKEALQSEVRHADNLLEIAKQVKAAVDHGQRLADLDLNFDVVVGRAKTGVRTEAQFNTVDRIVDKIQSTKLGQFVNETTLTSAVAIAYSVTAGLSKRVAQSKAAAWGSFGLTAVVGAGVAAAREGKRVTEERRQHSRELAKGKSYDQANSPRRQEMEAYRHETKSAVELTTALNTALEKPNLSQQEAEALASQVAEIASRIELSDRRRIDLISYSNGGAIEKERLDLDVARAKARVKLKNLYATQPGFAQPGQSVDQFITGSQEKETLNLIQKEGGLDARDRAFAKFKTKRVAVAALKGLATGLVVGGIFQEGSAMFRDNQHGVVEGMFGRPSHPQDIASITPLERLRMYLSGDSYSAAPGSVTDFHTPDGGTIKVPDSMSIYETAPHSGTYNLMENGNVKASGLHFANGQLTPDSALALHNAGIDTSVHMNSVTETIHGSSDLKKYVDQHPNTFKQIHRKLWYDNDTPAPVFDKNELKLDWGGQHGVGVDAKGNFVFNMSRMQPDGSYHSNFSVDAQKALVGGKLRMLLSLTRDTQMRPVELPIDANGNVVVDPNSAIGKMFFKTVNGKAVFMGKFAEVAEVMGKAPDGAENMRILATHIGKDAAEIMVPHEVPVTDMIPNSSPDVEPPPIIPLFGRKPLEPLAQKQLANETGSFYYGYGSYGGEGYGLLPRDQYRKRMAREILENKDFDLASNDKEIVREYLDKQDDDYISDLEEITKDAPEFDKNTEVVITIPSYQEGKNLEKTLRNYAKLHGRDKFEIVIFENHPQSKKRDNTPEVINKIRKEFPDLKIVHLYKEFKEKEPIGKFRKYLVDSVLLRKNKSDSEKPVAIVSNDADLEDISRNYALDIAAAFKNDQRLDAIGAKWDYPPDAFKKLPLLHASQRLWHYLDIALRNYHLKSPELIGRNSAFRSSAYAAVGGYNETSQLAEDLEIGWLIKEARGYDSSRIDYLNKAWLISNPRRAVVKLVSDNRLVQQYGDFHVNEEVREAPLDELLEKKPDLTEEELLKEVQAIYDHYNNMVKEGWIPQDLFTKSFNSAMRNLRVGYRVDEGKIRLISTKSLSEGIREYRGTDTLKKKNKLNRSPRQEREAAKPTPRFFLPRFTSKSKRKTA